MGLVPGEQNYAAAPPAKKALLSKLNDNEREVFNALCELKTLHEMALDFSLTVSGLKYHMNKVYRKLEISTCTEGTASKRLVLLREFTDCNKKEWVEL